MINYLNCMITYQTDSLIDLFTSNDTMHLTFYL